MYSIYSQIIYKFFKNLIMDSKVIVVADEATGSVINVSENNSEFGYVRVSQTRTMIDDNGFLKRRIVSALIPGKIEDLQATGFHAGQVLNGRVIIQEALLPFNQKNPERDLKIAGDTGILCTLGGLPIYRRTVFSFNEGLQDDLIKHDNVQELRAAYAASMKSNTSALKQAAVNDDFDIA
jgi:hypothetical protein